ncbi:MAG TPA: 2Fe-2S iron-sulfur cluster-binding protein [Bacteroidales bacterium]|nr:2Fe-2S iron-sulfur cluster-binding protein [Bacteroidales bacterium]
MPTIKFRNKTIHCQHGANLRETLNLQGLSPHNGTSRFFNCLGSGTCGTCAVKIEGLVSETTKAEKMRLSLPPHRPENGLRLACQVRVLGDIKVEKGEGFWGQYPANDGRKPKSAL